MSTKGIWILEDSTPIWLLMPGKRSEIQADVWVEEGYCATSWREAEEIPPAASMEEIHEAIHAAYSDKSYGTRNN